MTTIDLLAEKIGAQHVVFSSGGTQATVSGCGAACALVYASKLKRGVHPSDYLTSIGGVSGGATPALMLASRMAPEVMFERAIGTDMSGLLVRRETTGGKLDKVSAFLRNQLREGSYDSEAYGAHVAELVNNQWPSNFWTMASANGHPRIFTARGAFEVTSSNARNGHVTYRSNQIAHKPVSIATAICATIAVPGLIESVQHEGKHLYDGALTYMGGCPTEVPELLFQAAHRNVMGIVILPTRTAKALGELARFSIARRVKRRVHRINLGLNVNLPRLPFGIFDFSISRKQRKDLFVSGFQHTCQSLYELGELSEQGLRDALTACESEESLVNLLMECNFGT